MNESLRREPRHAGDAARIYRSDELEVTWEPRFCIHVAACIRGSARAFDPSRRPWVDVDAETPAQIVEIVEQCPTGALHARLTADEPATAQSPQAATEIQARRNGPLFIRGPVRITDSLGNVVREDTRVALCRCGSSENKPFCDGSHLRIGFTA